MSVRCGFAVDTLIPLAEASCALMGETALEVLAFTGYMPLLL